MSMREIKFRGKRADNGEWVYGSFIPDALEGSNSDLVSWGFIRRYNRDVSKMETIEVDRETVGQYTGFDDKNGVKIFEGDVLGGEYYFRGEGWFDTGEGEFPIDDPVIFKDGKFICRGFDLCKINECGEVIGNIYENSELVGKKK